jgi:hypothetical protein
MLGVRLVRGRTTEPTTAAEQQAMGNGIAADRLSNGNSGADLRAAAEPTLARFCTLLHSSRSVDHTCVSAKASPVLQSPDAHISHPEVQNFHPNLAPLEAPHWGRHASTEKFGLVKLRPTRRCAADVAPLFLKCAM